METTSKMIPGMAHNKLSDYPLSSMSTPPWRLVLFAIAFITALGCGTGHGDMNALYADAARNDHRARPYVIGVSDHVRVTVWKDPNLSTDAAVRPDGTITLPLVGEVVSAGLTVVELQGKIGERLAAFAKDAVVTVAVAEVDSYRFTRSRSREVRTATLRRETWSSSGARSVFPSTTMPSWPEGVRNKTSLSWPDAVRVP
jgi:Polysaccharide biosynthesis/export protein